jgi:hypothetical protein
MVWLRLDFSRNRRFEDLFFAALPQIAIAHGALRRLSV